MTTRRGLLRGALGILAAVALPLPKPPPVVRPTYRASVWLFEYGAGGFRLLEAEGLELEVPETDPETGAFLEDEAPGAIGAVLEMPPPRERWFGLRAT